MRVHPARETAIVAAFVFFFRNPLRQTMEHYQLTGTHEAGRKRIADYFDRAAPLQLDPAQIAGLLHQQLDIIPMEVACRRVLAWLDLVEPQLCRNRVKTDKTEEKSCAVACGIFNLP
ncbi:MAG TPA: hypothetical protein DCQ16_04345 [Spirochaetaceae bacterium]|nr:hypothetical protein [Spirochaetaceae bacterium]